MSCNSLVFSKLKMKTKRKNLWDRNKGEILLVIWCIIVIGLFFIYPGAEKNLYTILFLSIIFYISRKISLLSKNVKNRIVLTYFLIVSFFLGISGIPPFGSWITSGDWHIPTKSLIVDIPIYPLIFLSDNFNFNILHSYFFSTLILVIYYFILSSVIFFVYNKIRGRKNNEY